MHRVVITAQLLCITLVLTRTQLRFSSLPPQVCRRQSNHAFMFEIAERKFFLKTRLSGLLNKLSTKVDYERAETLENVAQLLAFTLESSV